MKLADMQNLFTAYNETEHFRMCVVANDADEALQVAQKYAYDTGMTDDFLITATVDVTANYDCDYVVTTNSTIVHS